MANEATRDCREPSALNGHVYRITNLVTGKSYVGITTKSVNSRWAEHRRAAARATPRWLLHKAMLRHGVDQFKVEVLERCACRASLDAAEQRWIISLGTLAPAGYNMTSGGGGVSGYRRSERLKQEQSERSRGQVMSADARARMSAAKQGRQLPQSTIEAMAAARRGAKHSEATKRKIGDARRGRKLPAEQVERLRQVRTGMRLSEESKAFLRRPVLAGGMEFPSIGEAAAALGVRATTVTRRIQRGLDGYKELVALRRRAKRTPEQVARMRAIVSTPVIAEHREFPSITEAADALGLTRPGVAYRIKTGRAGYRLLA